MAHDTPQPIPEESLEVGFEVRDTNFKLVWLALVGLTILIVMGFVIIYFLYGLFAVNWVRQVSPPPPLLQESLGLPQEPLLQRNPASDMSQMKADTDAILSSYGWINQEAGIVRIPITQAMELTLEEGLPARPAPGQ